MKQQFSDVKKPTGEVGSFTVSGAELVALTGGSLSTSNISTIHHNPDVKKPTGEVGFFTVPVLSWWL
ncbi:hypothetical protein [Citrobacter braakii]|uniref:hypothetical protein n=1 Tax=Citrobacter braakii TaxID=57706 RepID=UPI00397612C8